MGLVVVLLAVFTLALSAPGLSRAARGAAGWLLALVPAALLVYFALQAGRVAAGETIRFHFPWVPALGIDLTFRLDGLALLFAVLVSGIGALVLVYAGGYLAGHPRLGRFYAYLLLFMGSMLGLVLADNIFVLFVFWELTSISSYLLIGFDSERAEARAAALQALLVTAGGGLALLAGLALLGQAAGTTELSSLAARAGNLAAHPLALPALLLILVGAFTKSAQFPFSFWLPGAMEAPSPVSAYLHSATMVKAGVYLMARLSPALAGSDAWLWTVTGVGAVTMLAGAAQAVAATDLKQVLAHSTVSSLGLLTLLLGLGGEAAVVAAVAFLLGHALYKGALFLVAGTLQHETGTRDAGRLGGLARAMPVTALAAGLAALSMAGVPPLLGFLGKELVYEATLHAPGAALLTAAAVGANALLAAVAVVAGLRPFLGRKSPTPRAAHEAPPSLWLGALTLGGAGVALGLLPALGPDLLVTAAASSVLGQAREVHLAPWHGLTPVLALSGLTLLGGAAAFAGRVMAQRAAARRPARRPVGLAGWGPAAAYRAGLEGLNRLALAQTRVLQSGLLRYYITVILVATVALVGLPLLLAGAALPGEAAWADVQPHEAGISLLILLAILATVRARSRLAAIAALGVVGYGVALVFVLFGAPDVAMTQFLVETLTVILFVLVFYHLPEAPRAPRPAWTHVRDAGLGLAAGALMTGLALAVMGSRQPSPVSAYYAAQAGEAHGRNIVNVILVDFRGLDTLGEITVLAAAGVGVYALLKLRLHQPEEAGVSAGTPAAAPNGEAAATALAGPETNSGPGQPLEEVPARGTGGRP